MANLLASQSPRSANSVIRSARTATVHNFAEGPLESLQARRRNHDGVSARPCVFYNPKERTACIHLPAEGKCLQLDLNLGRVNGFNLDRLLRRCRSSEPDVCYFLEIRFVLRQDESEFHSLLNQTVGAAA